MFYKILSASLLLVSGINAMTMELPKSLEKHADQIGMLNALCSDDTNQLATLMKTHIEDDAKDNPLRVIISNLVILEKKKELTFEQLCAWISQSNKMRLQDKNTWLAAKVKDALEYTLIVAIGSSRNKVVESLLKLGITINTEHPLFIDALMKTVADDNRSLLEIIISQKVKIPHIFVRTDKKNEQGEQITYGDLSSWACGYLNLDAMALILQNAEQERK